MAIFIDTEKVIVKSDLEGKFMIQKVYEPTTEAFDDPVAGKVVVQTLRIDLLENIGEDVVALFQHFVSEEVDFYAAMSCITKVL